jgi:predicted RNA-binding protein with PUA-like domain
MAYWLMKSEPSVFGIDDLARSPGRRTSWEGVRNYQVRNMIRDDMRPGDRAFFYHSSCPEPGIAGVMKIVSRGYPDPTAFDLRSRHDDPDSDGEAPRWYAVDVELEHRFGRVITLAELRAHKALAALAILRRGNRLSITPVTTAQWRAVLGIVGDG